jgi:hypothetical protein
MNSSAVVNKQHKSGGMTNNDNSQHLNQGRSAPKVSIRKLVQSILEKNGCNSTL